MGNTYLQHHAVGVNLAQITGH